MEVQPCLARVAKSRQGSPPARAAIACSISVNQLAYISGQGGLKSQLFARYRVPKAQLCRVQGLSWKGAQYGQSLSGDAIRHLASARRPAIDRIAYQPMANMRHMHTDLMGSASFQPTFRQPAKGRQITQNPIICAGRPSLLCHCLAFAVLAMAAQLFINQPFSGRRQPQTSP